MVLTALATVGAIVYGSMINLQNNFEKYEVSFVQASDARHGYVHRHDDDTRLFLMWWWWRATAYLL